MTRPAYSLTTQAALFFVCLFHIVRYRSSGWFVIVMHTQSSSQPNRTATNQAAAAMKTSIEHRVAPMDVGGELDPEHHIWRQYEDALFEIAKLREELHCKNSQIESLTETIVQMSMELATAKAKEDELSMAVRRMSGVESSTAENGKVQERNNSPMSRKASRRNSRADNEHSHSIAVQNPSSHRRKSTTRTQRNKSDSWAIRAEEVRVTEGETVDDSFRSRLGSRLGWGLEGELGKTKSDREIKKKSEPSKESKSHNQKNQGPRRGLGSFVRSMSGREPMNDDIKVSTKSPPPSPKQDENEQLDESSPNLRRPNPRRRDSTATGLHGSRVLFPVGSTDLLDEFFADGQPQP